MKEVNAQMTIHLKKFIGCLLREKSFTNAGITKMIVNIIVAKGDTFGNKEWDIS